MTIKCLKQVWRKVVESCIIRSMNHSSTYIKCEYVPMKYASLCRLVHCGGFEKRIAKLRGNFVFIARLGRSWWRRSIWAACLERECQCSHFNDSSEGPRSNVFILSTRIHHRHHNTLAFLNPPHFIINNFALIYFTQPKTTGSVLFLHQP